MCDSFVGQILPAFGHLQTNTQELVFNFDLEMLMMYRTDPFPIL